MLNTIRIISDLLTAHSNGEKLKSFSLILGMRQWYLFLSLLFNVILESATRALQAGEIVIIQAPRSELVSVCRDHQSIYRILLKLHQNELVKNNSTKNLRHYHTLMNKMQEDKNKQNILCLWSRRFIIAKNIWTVQGDPIKRPMTSSSPQEIQKLILKLVCCYKKSMHSQSTLEKNKAEDITLPDLQIYN